MNIRESYNSWPLSRQLQVTFTVASVLLTLILVIITKFQMGWLQSSLQQDSQDLLQTNAVAQMTVLGLAEQAYLNQEFSNYIGLVESLEAMNSLILGFTGTPPLNQTTVVFSNSMAVGTVSYSQASYFSKDTITSDGALLLEKCSAFNPVYVLMQQSSILNLYQGYFTDEILYLYPGSYISSATYTPLAREWFYKATEAPGQVIITEPYIDASSGNWIISASKAIIETNGTVYGVAAADITLEILTTKIANAKILENGFAMLISAEGIILSCPVNLQVPSSTRIYNQTSTGITQTLWGTMQNSTQGTLFDFIGFNGTEFLSVLYKVTPYKKTGNVTHYIMIMANKTDLSKPSTDLSNSFGTASDVIFWVVLSISVAVLVITLTLLYLESRQVAQRLRNVEKTFIKINRRGLFPKITRGVGYEKMKNNSKGIENLIDACIHHIEKLQAKEESFENYRWGITRPSDINLFSEWTEDMHPFNLYHDKPMSWRQAFPQLDKAVNNEEV